MAFLYVFMSRKAQNKQTNIKINIFEKKKHFFYC